MGLKFKPHTVAVYAIVETVDSKGNVTAPPTYPKGVTVTGQLSPNKGANAKFDQKTGIQLTNPHVFYCDHTDYPSFQYGYRVTYGNRTFTVTESPNLWDAGGAASSARNGQVQLEELELA